MFVGWFQFDNKMRQTKKNRKWAKVVIMAYQRPKRLSRLYRLVGYGGFVLAMVLAVGFASVENAVANLR
jgi:RsiW-degrading membrane proteinase PrsW (M82 family)